jgi:hypothetical protein
MCLQTLPSLSHPGRIAPVQSQADNDTSSPTGLHRRNCELEAAEEHHVHIHILRDPCGCLDLGFRDTTEHRQTTRPDEGDRGGPGGQGGQRQDPSLSRTLVAYAYAARRKHADKTVQPVCTYSRYRWFYFCAHQRKDACKSPVP